MRGRCLPDDTTFKECSMRIDTAVWLCQNGYEEDFYNLLDDDDYDELSVALMICEDEE